MAGAVDLWEKPKAEQINMLVGWRQWADAGTVSSGLPAYLIERLGAEKIGEIRPDGFYLFQIPGTHDLVRPVVKFDQGYPESLDTPHNEFFYKGDQNHGLVIFEGDEPHIDVERYIASVLDAAEELGVKRIVGFGGVYGELPYDKERMISANYSIPEMKDSLEKLAVNFSDYHGGASIGSYICKRAGERGMEYVGLYAFVPTYDFSKVSEVGNAIRLEKDYTAWLGVMRRVNFMLNLNFDLADLEAKSEQLTKLVDAKVEEIDQAAPEIGIRAYLDQLSEEFDSQTFEPLDEFWEDELKRLFDKMDNGDDE